MYFPMESFRMENSKDVFLCVHSTVFILTIPTSWAPGSLEKHNTAERSSPSVFMRQVLRPSRAFLKTKKQAVRAAPDSLSRYIQNQKLISATNPRSPLKLMTL